MIPSRDGKGRLESAAAEQEVRRGGPEQRRGDDPRPAPERTHPGRTPVLVRIRGNLQRLLGHDLHRPGDGRRVRLGGGGRFAGGLVLHAACILRERARQERADGHNVAAMRFVSPRRVAELYRSEMHEPRHERLFLSSVAFFSAFAVTRGITHAIRRGIGPFRNMSVGGHHLHHLVFGIAGLLGSGYLWLVQVGTGKPGQDDRLSAATAMIYGAGAAITLDEFALWLNLEDVYWAKQGRESVDAVLFFGAVLSIGLWGRPFFRALIREARHLEDPEARRTVHS